MKRLIMVALSAIVVFGFSLGAMAAIQDSGTPAAIDVDCATPGVEATPGVDATPTVATPAVATPESATPQANDPCAENEANGGEEVLVEFVDIAFVQNEITIPADTDVTFTFVNKGNMQHDFKIDDPEVYSGILNGGQEAELTVNLPAGTYEFYCSIPGHKEGGMVGTLTVE